MSEAGAEPEFDVRKIDAANQVKAIGLRMLDAETAKRGKNPFSISSAPAAAPIIAVASSKEPRRCS